MNLFLALFWLLCALMLLAYEQTAGPTRFRLWIGNQPFSYAWLMFLLVLYNLYRWWWMRSYRAKQRAAAITRAEEERQRRRHSTAATETFEPHRPSTDEPSAPTDHGIPD
jgi:H+/Cl- antiporter ClcA